MGRHRRRPRARLHDLAGGAVMDMSFINSSILALVTFVPAIGALLLVVFPRKAVAERWFALAVAVANFILSLSLLRHEIPTQLSTASIFQYEVDIPWITSPNIHYHLGVDGISLWLVILTTFLVPLSILVSWHSVSHRVKEFYVLLLLLETAMIGVFLALGMFLFYVFWEATLIPMALLIGIWGHERRIYAAVKFFLYTAIASVFMLGAIIWLYAHAGSFDYTTIRAQIQSGHLAVSWNAARWLFLGFFIAF